MKVVTICKGKSSSIYSLKCFTRKLISHQLCIFNPVAFKKLMGEMMQH